uniref:Uncharacterized protein n=1 Tax=Ignisphaera aggregans TaxID=334771 RepID=A0A7C2VMM8_9CREN
MISDSTKRTYHDALIYIFSGSSIVFMAVAVLFIYIEKYIQSLLSFVIGLIFLSGALSLLRERIYR